MRKITEAEWPLFILSIILFVFAIISLVLTYHIQINEIITVYSIFLTSLMSYNLSSRPKKEQEEE